MKSNRERLVVLNLSLTLLTCLGVGCSNDELYKEKATLQTDAKASSDSQPAKIHIQFAQWSVPSTKFVEEAISRFNENNKENIQIDLLNIPLDRYIETLNKLNASGSGPDVFELPKEWLNSYITKEWVTDLSPIISPAFLSSFPDWAVNSSKELLDSQDRMYSLPSNQLTYRLIYNKDLFRESGLDPDSPPKTFSELVEAAQIISNKEIGRSKYGIAMPMGEVWMDFVQPMEAINGYSGVHYYDFKTGKYDLTVYKPWLKTIKELNENGGVFPGMENMKSNQAMAQFADGNIGMMIASSWQASLLFDQFSPKSDWGVALPPAIDNARLGKGAIKIDTAGWNVVGSGTPYPEAAAKVWKFLYSDEYIGQLFAHSNMIPVINKQASDLANPIGTSHFRQFLPSSNDSVYPDTPLILEEWSRKKIYQKALAGNQDDPSLLEESSRLNTLLDVAVTSMTININNYYFPNFNPLTPLDRK
ncbi:ABC transporter substrate-binding protein [Paenibacillus baekrokdamisoli]|uniref:ABC transporter substrate-binding protein n=1 Tax=Paenibacillus baekrokdamisoli TaxID=1712516 RepID=A0A3G9ITX5_9BACL|nr:extracellular solute-binding protein [Paenibacillus baekrokdamisoli]MBB3073332.1 multiple sugar transport system substrate-binding protein [Paenibacillus baekrokdamisoli]BBH22320.1 ABC transporter substrate-binding protein [Paenibacillus baekrokdamisoli]